MSDEQTVVDDVVAEALAEAQSQVSSLQGEVDAVAGMDARAQTGIDMLGDVDLQVTVELGRTEMLVEDVLRLGNGSVVELNKLAGDPVDVFVNGRLVARGEVLVLNDNFCIRISEIISGAEEVLPESAKAAVSGAIEGG
ncbi:MAG: flagellar motor switch protein FliN [Phycisphaerales bacterium JB063]